MKGVLKEVVRDPILDMRLIPGSWFWSWCSSQNADIGVWTMGLEAGLGPTRPSRSILIRDQLVRLPE